MELFGSNKMKQEELKTLREERDSDKNVKHTRRNKQPVVSMFSDFFMRN